MRFSCFTLAAVLALAACQETPTVSAPGTSQAIPGNLAMRLSSDVVYQTSSVADSVTLRVIPLDGSAPPQTQTWPLVETELLFESLPATACSVLVDLTNRSGQILLRGATSVTIQAGRTTSADIALRVLASGALSVNLSIEGLSPDFAPPRASPEAGSYDDSVNIVLSNPYPTSQIQFRVEDDSQGIGAEWQRYVAPIKITRSSKLFSRTINGTDTGTFTTSMYVVRQDRSVLFDGFETVVGTGPGWNGRMITSSIQQSGVIVPNGTWGSASAKITTGMVSLYSTTAGGEFLGRSIPRDSAIDWSRLKQIRLKIKTSIPREFDFTLLSSQADYYTANNLGQFLTRRVSIPAMALELIIPVSRFAYFPELPAGPSLATVLTGMTGLRISAVCSTPQGASGCDEASPSSFEIDEIFVDLN